MPTLPAHSLAILVTGGIALVAALLIWIAARQAPDGIEYKLWLKAVRKLNKFRRAFAR